jgi:hypothetical protein
MLCISGHFNFFSPSVAGLRIAVREGDFDFYSLIRWDMQLSCTHSSKEDRYESARCSRYLPHREKRNIIAEIADSKKGMVFF